MSEDKKTPLVNINRDRYVTTRTASGGKSLSNGDEIANALQGIAVDDLYVICDKLVPENDYQKKYSKLNVGMQRMNLGNRLRGFVTKRDAENVAIQAAADKDGKDAKLKNAGIDAVIKAAAPARKVADKAATQAEKDRNEKAEKAAAAKEAKATKAKAKKDTKKEGKAA